jgi:hypothetical protein
MLPLDASTNDSVTDSLPVAVYGVAIAFSVHAPASMLYHGYYASRIPCVLERTHHWSRRLDHILIHVASWFLACSLAYAASKSIVSWDSMIAFVILVSLWNAVAIYGHASETTCHPQRNQILVLGATLLYTLPLLTLDASRFVQAWCMLGTGFALFKWYPLGGWSHGLFHLALTGLPPLLMHAAFHMSQPNEMEAMRLYFNRL